MTAQSPKVCVLGPTGTIGRAVMAELARRKLDTVGFARGSNDVPLPRQTLQIVDVTDPPALARAMRAAKPDVVISCLASRTGVATDAWAIDYHAQVSALDAARAVGAKQFILLSAICVQKPRLAFQHAKLAFEAALTEFEMRYSIVRPTAFFKSLSGQVERVRRGKPFLMFGDGRLTACKPISDRDLAVYLVDCIDDPDRWNRILPIGGPGAAIGPRDQGEALFALTGRPPRFRSVPPGLLKAIALVLGGAARVLPRLATKAELARIGHYYATESMLVWDPVRGVYDAAATPSAGSDTLFDHYRAMLAGTATVDLGTHAAFEADARTYTG